MTRDCRGFTLIELMVCVLIIGLVGSMAVPMYGDAMSRSRKTAVVGDCEGLYDALDRAGQRLEPLAGDARRERPWWAQHPEAR